MSFSPRLLVDGCSPSVESLAPFVLANDGHFTAMQVRGGATRRLGLHLKRLADAHEQLYGSMLDTDFVRASMRRAIDDAPDCYLKVVVLKSLDGASHVLTVVRPPLEAGLEPMHLTAIKWIRAFPHIKHVGTFPQIHIGRMSEAQGFDDALLVDSEGFVAETTIGNIAFLAERNVIWPAGPALQGIGWTILENELSVHGFRSSRERVPIHEIDRFDAAVMVNSIGVTPVGSIDSVAFTGSRGAASDLGAIYEKIDFDRI